MVQKILEKVAKIEEQRPFLVIGIFLLLTLFFISGFALINFEASFESFVPENEAIESLEIIRDKFGSGTTTIILIYQTDPADPQGITDIRDRKVLEAMNIIDQQIEQHELVLSSTSIVDIVREGNRFPEQGEINMLLDSPQAEGLLSDDYSLAVARFIVPDDLSQEQREEIVNEVYAIASFSETPAGITVTPAGPIVEELEIGRSIGQNIGFVTTLGFVGVFIVLYLLFRRFEFVILSVIPVFLGTLWTYGSLGWIGISLSTPLVGVFSMIIGIGIDFSIHVLHRFGEEIRKSSLEQAIASSVQNVGKGLAMTTITTIIGFLALLIAVLPVLKDMAIALSLGVFFTFVITLGVIPPCLVLAERWRMKRGRKRSASQ
jgi:hydrophobe/amphiphile efflux-3 (HAE3) family protein